MRRDYPVVPKSSWNQPTASGAGVTKSVMKWKLPPVLSVNPSKLMNLGQELPSTKSKSRKFPMKIWEFQFEDGSGVWGKADLRGLNWWGILGRAGIEISKEALMNGRTEVMKLYTAKSKEVMTAQGIIPEAHARLSIQTQANVPAFGRWDFRYILKQP